MEIGIKNGHIKINPAEIKFHASFMRCENLDCPGQGTTAGWCFSTNWLNNQQQTQFKRSQAAKGYDWVKSTDATGYRYHSMDTNRLYFCPCKLRLEEMDKMKEKKMKKHSPVVQALTDLEPPTDFINGVLIALQQTGLKLDVYQTQDIFEIDKAQNPINDPICMGKDWIEIKN